MGKVSKPIKIVLFGYDLPEENVCMQFSAVFWLKIDFSTWNPNQKVNFEPKTAENRIKNIFLG